MKTGLFPALFVLLGLSLCPVAAQDDSAAALAKVAEAFVKSYNDKNLEAILELYTPEAEMIDEIDGLSASGKDEIQRIFETSFAKYPDRRIELEVLSVRQIAENVVVEEGITHYSGEVPNEEGDAIYYSAVIVKSPDKGWQIASAREISAVPTESGPLDSLFPLAGDWVVQGDQLQMDLSFYLANSGRALLGTAYITTPGEGKMGSEIRIGYDASLEQIRWWSFDEAGGFGEGLWQQLDDGSWLIRSNGVTADGETTTAIQRLRFETDDLIIWESEHRFMDGVALPDTEVRLVRRPPSPIAPLPSDVSADEATASEAQPEPETAPKP